MRILMDMLKGLKSGLHICLYMHYVIFENIILFIKLYLKKDQKF